MSCASLSARPIGSVTLDMYDIEQVPTQRSFSLDDKPAHEQVLDNLNQATVWSTIID